MHFPAALSTWPNTTMSTSRNESVQSYQVVITFVKRYMQEICLLAYPRLMIRLFCAEPILCLFHQVMSNQMRSIATLTNMKCPVIYSCGTCTSRSRSVEVINWYWTIRIYVWRMHQSTYLLVSMYVFIKPPIQPSMYVNRASVVLSSTFFVLNVSDMCKIKIGSNVMVQCLLSAFQKFSDY